MTERSKVVELDIHQMAITGEGVDPYYWPIARREVGAFSDQVTKDVIGVNRREGQLLFGLIAPYFAMEAGAVFESLALVQRAAADDRVLRPPARWRYFTAIANGGVPPRSHILTWLRAGPPEAALWRRALRPLWLVHQREPVMRVPLAFINLKRDIATTMPGGLIDSHASKTEEDVKLIRQEWLFRSISPEEERAADSSDAGRVAEAIVTLARERSSTFGVDVPDKLSRHLQMWLRSAFATMEVHTSRLLASDKVPDKLWTGTGGNPWSRMLRHCVRVKGGFVTGHDHATGEGHRPSPTKIVTEMAACDRFVTFNGAQAQALRSVLDPSLLLHDAPEIVGLAGDQHGASFEKRRVPPRTTEPDRSVMVVTTILRGDSNHHGTVLPDMTAVDFQTRLFARMSEWGFQVIHKPHPETRTPPPSAFYADLGAIQAGGYFENAVRSASRILLIQDVSSTTLRIALEAGKPVTVIDLERFPWNPEARELLEKRSAIVEARIDESNRVQIDWDELKRALERSPYLTDNSFQELFLRY